MRILEIVPIFVILWEVGIPRAQQGTICTCWKYSTIDFNILFLSICFAAVVVTVKWSSHKTYIEPVNFQRINYCHILMLVKIDIYNSKWERKFSSHKHHFNSNLIISLFIQLRIIQKPRKIKSLCFRRDFRRGRELCLLQVWNKSRRGCVWGKGRYMCLSKVC